MPGKGLDNLQTTRALLFLGFSSGKTHRKVANQMDPAHFKSLPELLARERMASYLEATGGRADRALRLYIWNVEVSAAFWRPLHLLEIGLRNAIDAQMRYHYETAWWWRKTRARLHQNMQSQLEEAEASAVVSTKLGSGNRFFTRRSQLHRLAANPA
jgi:hypothetical protein